MKYSGGVATLATALLVVLSGCDSVLVPPDGGILSSVAIAPQPPQIEENETLQLQATLTTADGTPVSGRPVIWTSEDPEVAHVSSSGLLRGVSPGTTRIAASSEGVSAVATVTVVPRQVARVAVTPGTLNLLSGQIEQLQATARDRSDAVMPGTATWSSGNSAIATVDANGRVTGAGAGSTTITATIGGRTGTASVTVTLRPVATVTISPPTATLVVGAEQPFVATPRAADGTILSGRQVFWSSSNPAVASVSAAGVVTARAAGAAAITALIEGQSATANISVSVTPVASVQVAPNTLRLPVGRTQRVVATTLAADGAPLEDRVVAWTSADPAVATVDEDGVIRGVAVGTTLVKAASEGLIENVSVTVIPEPVARIVLTPAGAQLTVGQTQQFSASTLAADGRVLTDRPIAWSSSAPGVATVSPSGLVTALSIGQTTITATSEGVNAAATVAVTAVPVATVEIDPTTAALIVGGSRQFTAVAKAADGAVLQNRAITWSSSQPSVATVSTTGLVTAVAAGQTSITATSEGRSASASVTVTAIPVATVDISPATVSLVAGNTQQFTATPRSADGTALSGRQITWSSSDAGVVTVSGTGLAVGVGQGSGTITATVEGRTANASVTVTHVPVSTVEVSPPSTQLAVGGSTQLTATLKAADGSTLNGRSVTWSSSNNSIATVSSGGLVTAVAAGNATITARSEGQSGTAAVAVAAATVETVAISPSSAELTVGATRQLTATARGQDGSILSGRSVTWTSSNTTVATVTGNGLVTGRAAGNATITATIEGKSGTAAIAVSQVPVESVQVSPSTGQVNVGGTLQLNASPRAADGAALTGRTVTWASSNTSVATVNGSGVVTGVATGSATITATSEGKSGTASVTVTGLPPASISIVSGNGQTFSNNQTLSNPLVVRVLDALGAPVAGATVRWSTGSGSLSPETSVTGADGRASASWTLGPGPPGERTATATVVGVSGLSVQFTATR